MNSHRSTNIKTLVVRILKVLSKILPVPILYSFKLSTDEKALFVKLIRNAQLYLEFGMGGSTISVLKNSKGKVYTVESSPSWTNSMLAYRFIRNMIKSQRLHLVPVDIGEISAWGYPVDDTKKQLFPNYSTLVFNQIDVDAVDVVFIDGRFRVACILQCIIYLNKKVTIIVHDFWRRDDYHVVLKYLTLVNRVDSMAVFKIKNELCVNDILNDYNLFKYNVI